MAELDLPLKMRIERVFWAAGFYTRANVKLASVAARSASGGRVANELTDVDVFGVRFAEDLTPRRIAADCKSGKNVSPIGRAFWLKGVMDHLDAGRGYVVMARRVPEHQRGAAAKLGITLSQDTDLDVLEARYPKLPDRSRIGREDAHRYLEGNLVNVSKSLSRMLEFRDTVYWYQSPARAIMHAIVLTQHWSDKIDIKQKFHKALLLDIIGLFSLALLTVAADLLRLGPANLIDDTRNLFFGGQEGISRREELIRGIQEIVTTLSQQSSLPFEDASLFRLDPPYLAPIAEVLARLIARPIEAAQAPRYLKMRLVHGVLYDEWNIQELFGEEYSALADKLAGDLAIAFLKASGLGTEAALAMGFK